MGFALNEVIVVFCILLNSACLQANQKSHNILNFLAAEYGLTCKLGGHAIEPFGAVIGRHDGAGIKATGVYYSGSQLRLA